MLQCTPFLLFDGNCAEAMTFYQQCLGGELTLTKLGDTLMKAQFPPEKHNRIINAHLKSGAIEISATDWMASPALEPKQGNMSAIFVIGGTYDEKHIKSSCKEDQIRSRPSKSFVMKAWGDHSGSLSPKNATPRRLTSD